MASVDDAGQSREIDSMATQAPPVTRGAESRETLNVMS